MPVPEAGVNSVMAADPSPNQLLHDSAKSITTLATAVLAVTVSLLTAFEAASHELPWFAMGWLLLLAVILLCILASGGVIKGIKNEGEPKPGLWLNIAFYGFLVAGLLLSIGAFFTIKRDDAPTLDGIRSSAVAAVAELAPRAKGVEVTAIRVNSPEIEVDLSDSDDVAYLVTLTAQDREVRSVAAQP